MEKKLEKLRKNEREAFVASVYNRAYADDFDASIFCHAVVEEETGELRLYVPAENRIRWFRLRNPLARISVSEPKIFGSKVYVHAEIFANRNDAYPVASNNAESKAGEQYAAEIASTRAISRALRVAGYDLPVNAHFIEGWTPVERDGKVPEDALESSVRVEDMLPDMSFIKTEKQKSSEDKIIRMPKEDPKQDPPKAEEAPTPVPVPTPVPAVNPAQEPDPGPEAEDPFEKLVQEAGKAFSLEEALSLKSKMLAGRSMADLPEPDLLRRLNAYSEHMKKGKSLSDPDFGKAILVVARHRGIC